MKKLLFALMTLFCSLASNAQIGYQVSLLNSATGEPRSNETVECKITLLDSEETVICSETKKAVSNDFGVISLSVGNANTFDYVDWSKLPFFVEVSVGGSLIGRSQILTVPVAEHAKHYGTLTYENIHEKKVEVSSIVGSCELVFNDSTATALFSIVDMDDELQMVSVPGRVFIDGNAVFGYLGNETEKSFFIGHYSPENDTIYLFLSTPITFS